VAPRPAYTDVVSDHPWHRLRRLANSLTHRLGRRDPSSEPTTAHHAPGAAGEPVPSDLQAMLGSAPPRHAITDARPGVLVTAPFLARGGAEQTLFATLEALAPTNRIVFATLAHHLPELGDRRQDFAAISPDLYSLGDWMHPDAMLPVLLRIIDSHRIRTLYNANSTTLFYDFARAIRRDRPRVRIVDHLYDHRVGYIEWYRQSDLVDCIDACVAENQPIADTLEADYGWPRDRAPVIWPCGRPPADLPPTAEHAAIRSRLRAELELPTDAVVVLVAARMHEQKRPLDLVRLARAVQDLERVHIVVAGGGPLEGAVDRAIAQAPEARIRRLGFRSDVPDLIVAADAGCLVSEFEGLPVFLLECLQLGRPFLGTEVGDLGRVLRDTGAGIVVHEPGDIDGLAAGVRRLADDRERCVLAEAARAAAHRFDPLHCATTCARALDLAPPPGQPTT
jgi:glycosyltransferase involved in cell wall biosynthesis